MRVTIEHELGRLNTTLALYVQSTGKTVEEVLAKKGRDLGIKLYQGFRTRRWGRGAIKGRVLARAELSERTIRGQGTRVRASLLREYRGLRARLLATRAVANMRDDQRGVSRTIRGAVSLWQRFVGREIALRSRGIGVLGVSFLWYRRRISRGRIEFARSKSGRTLGYVETGADYLRVVGLTEGLDQVSARYGIVARAVADVRIDTDNYIARKWPEKFREAARKAGLPAT